MGRRSRLCRAHAAELAVLPQRQVRTVHGFALGAVDVGQLDVLAG
jgi:hypothetical protein